MKIRYFLMAFLAPLVTLLTHAAITGVSPMTTLDNMATAVAEAMADPLPLQGPGLGNLTYTSAELFKPVSVITSPNHPLDPAHSSAYESREVPATYPGRKDYGMNAGIMINGYFLTSFAPDSGLGPGGFLLYDVSNPRQIQLVKKIYEPDDAQGSHQGVPRNALLRHREDRRQDVRGAAQHQRCRVLGLHRHQRHQAGEEAGAARRQLRRLRERRLAALVAGALPVRGLRGPRHVHRRRHRPRKRRGCEPRRGQAQPGAHGRARQFPDRPDLHHGQPHGADRDGKQRRVREPGHLRPAQPQGARFHRGHHAVLLRHLLRRQKPARLDARRRRQDVQLRPGRPLALRGRGQPAGHRRAAVLRHAGQLRHPGRANPHPQGRREQPAEPRRGGPRQHPARGRPELLAFGQRPGRDVRQPRLRGQRPRLGQRLHRACGGPGHHQA